MTETTHTQPPVTPLVPAADLIAKRCGISRKTAERLIQKGVVPTVRVGRRHQIDPASLERWIEAGGKGPAKS